MVATQTLHQPDQTIKSLPRNAQNLITVVQHSLTCLKIKSDHDETIKYILGVRPASAAIPICYPYLKSHFTLLIQCPPIIPWLLAAVGPISQYIDTLDAAAVLAAVILFLCTVQRSHSCAASNVARLETYKLSALVCMRSSTTLLMSATPLGCLEAHKGPAGA